MWRDWNPPRYGRIQHASWQPSRQVASKLPTFEMDLLGGGVGPLGRLRQVRPKSDDRKYSAAGGDDLAVAARGAAVEDERVA